MQVFDIAVVTFAQVIRMVPVRLGVIEDEFEIVLMAGIGHGAHHIHLPCGGRPGGSIISQLRVIQAESVMVFDQEDQILLTGRFGDLDPMLSIESIRPPFLI